MKEESVDIPIQKNRKWVASLHKRIDELGPGLTRKIMSAAGVDCASDVWTHCEARLGKPLTTVEELVEGWNLLREARNLRGRWVMENGAPHGVFHECGCPLVQSGLIEPHPAQCHCSLAMMESVFSRVAGKPVEVILKRSIARGDDVCEFMATP